MRKPRVFIASSQEGKAVVTALASNLEGTADAVPWWTSFTLGAYVIDELRRNLEESDFGVFVFYPDDTLQIRELETAATRDNVVLELGMFLGRLGNKRSFIVAPANVPLRIPTDLLGITVATYDLDRVKKKEAEAALTSATSKITDAIAKYTEAFSSKAAERLNAVVKGSLETVCRALSVPVTPEQAALRAFIFQRENDRLVCRHYWDPNPSDEEVGVTSFPIDQEVAKTVVVVRCYLDKQLSRSASCDDSPISGSVAPLPASVRKAAGKVKSNLTHVLAAPIRDKNGEIWGVIDFDTSNKKGEKMLTSKCASNTIVALARQLTDLVTEV